MPLDDMKLDVLAGHYSETSELIQANQKRRDRLFASCFSLLRLDEIEVRPFPIEHEGCESDCHDVP